MTPIPLGPSAPGDQVTSIVLSIDSKWVDPLASGRLLHLIRKRVPVLNPPRFVYLHAKSPVSAIVAKAELQQVTKVPVSEAVKLSGELGISANAIEKYAGQSSQIGLLVFKHVAPAHVPGRLATLREQLEYHPPQSFSFVSDEAAAVIDEICGF